MHWSTRYWVSISAINYICYFDNLQAVINRFMFIGMQLSSRSIPSLRQNISYSHSIQLYAIRFNASNNFDMMWIAIISSIFEGSNQCNLSLEQSALIEWVVFKTTFPLCNCEKSRVFFFKFNCNLSPCRLLITCKFHEIDWGGGEGRKGRHWKILFQMQQPGRIELQMLYRSFI